MDHIEVARANLKEAQTYQEGKGYNATNLQVSIAIAHALIAIAQELRRDNDSTAEMRAEWAENKRDCDEPGF